MATRHAIWPDGPCGLQDGRTNADNCRMAVRRPLLLVLAAVVVGAVLFATLNRHHTTPEVPPVRELSIAEARKTLSTLQVPRSFNRSTRCPGETWKPEVCFIHRPQVALTLTRAKRWMTETGLASLAMNCTLGHESSLCVDSARRGATEVIVGLSSTSGGNRPNLDSAGNRGVPFGFLNGTTTLKVGVVGERIQRP